MNALIIIISITLFIVLGTIIYNELNDMENRKKFIVIFFEIIICLIFSILILKFSSFGIKYPTDRNKNSVTKILVAIFTTAISAGYSFLANCTKSKKQYTYWTIIMCITSILVSKLSFSGLINLLYPIFGYLGIIQIIFILNLKKAS